MKKLKSQVKSNVERAIANNINPKEIIEYINAEGYEYSDIASTSDKISGYIMKGLQGLTMGHADEIGGGLLSLVSGEPYEQSRDQIRTAEKVFNEANPVSSPVAEIAGGLTTGLLGLGGKANTLKNLAKTGGLMGAASGHGYSESSTLKDKAIDTAIGGVVGTALGAASKPIIDFTKWGASSLISPLANAINQANPSRVGRDVVRDLTADSLTVDDALAKLKAMGDESILADVGGGNVKQLAEHVAQTPGKGVDKAEHFLTYRDLGQGNRISTETAKITGKHQNYYDEMDDLLAKRLEEAKPLYDSYVNDLSNTVDMGDLANTLKDDPFLMKQFEKISKDELWGVSGLKPNTIKFIDAVKRSLNDMQSNLSNPTNKQKNAARQVEGSLKRLLTMTDEKVPGYADARKAYAVPSKQMEAMENGRKFMRGDTELVAKQVKNLQGDLKEYFLSGVVKEIENIMRSAPDNADLYKRVFGSQKKRDAIKAAFNDDEMFKKFDALMKREKVFNQTKQQMLGNSSTYKRGAKAKQAGGGMMDAAIDAAQSNPIGAAKNATIGFLRGLNQGYSPQELEQLSNILYTPQRDIVKSGVQRELLKKQGLLTLSDLQEKLMGSGLLSYGATQVQPAVHNLLRQ